MNNILLLLAFCICVYAQVPANAGPPMSNLGAYSNMPIPSGTFNGKSSVIKIAIDSNVFGSTQNQVLMFTDQTKHVVAFQFDLSIVPINNLATPFNFGKSIIH